MITTIWIYWIISLTIVTYASAYIVRRHREHGFAALTAFYVIYLGASQIIAVRIIDFDLGFISFFAPAAVFIYPFIAQAIDMINEVYGMKKTQLAIGIAFTTQVLLVLFFYMTNTLPPAPFFEHESVWQGIFGLSIRITIASWISFLINQNIDAWVFTKLKEKMPRQVVLRSIGSDFADLTLDSLIFVPLAFAGTGTPLMPLIIGQIVTKNVIGLLDTPWFVWYKRMIG
ncbi:MAG: queuosine precursor transporter [Candidatus Altiarchaeales archaeon]|nr:queuosine precursor transporter [Candidatus Altiarchaeales archaeon]MBD3416317.1 queuosine precursor transporter [Candidatus Altiarchaeales archaeon]